MSDNQSSYRQIFKATSIFGGVQVFTIIISIIRSKFVALLLGPQGMGIMSLLNSTIQFIASATNFGLERSAVKNIASANAKDEKKEIAIVVRILRKLVWLTGIIGTLFTLLFSKWLSKVTFGSEEYRVAFIWISITLLINQISFGQSALLRGLRKLKQMAKASLWGSLGGLIITIPIYYWFGLKGIVPGIIVVSICTLFFTHYFSKNVEIDSIKPNITDFKTQGKEMLTMGLMLNMSSLIVLGASYLVRIYIRQFGSITDVGYYNAGFAIINTYFGVFFTSLTTDYYPRLASIAHNNFKAIKLMNQQSEMTILIISPVLSIFLVFINIIVIVLYSKEFSPINEMILWAALGIYFKAASWAIGVIYISKGDVKLLFWSELISNIVLLIFNIIGYNLWGLEGLGVSFCISFIFTFGLNFFIIKQKYQFHYSLEFYKIFLLQLLFGIICFSVVKFIGTPINYFIGSFIIILVTIYSIIHLDKRIAIFTAIKKLLP